MRPGAAFFWPLCRLGWASEIPPLIWHDLIWRISVLLLLSDVWTHMWGLRLREVFPQLLWELMGDNSAPRLKQERGSGAGREGRTFWHSVVRAAETRSSTLSVSTTESDRPEVSFMTSTTFPFSVLLSPVISLWLSWASQSFDSCVWSVVTRVWREGCVRLAVCCLIVSSGLFGVLCLGLPISVCEPQADEPLGWAHVYMMMVK